MSGRLQDHSEVAPRRRVPTDKHGDDGYFYPREIVTLLGLADIDYYQLRRLLLLVRKQSGAAPPAEGRWARYSLIDIAALEVALNLCGGREALAPGRRLQIASLSKALEALRGMGFRNPLLDVPLRREGRRVLAVVSGTLLDPTTSQLALNESFQRAEGFLAARQVTDRELSQRLADERRRKTARINQSGASGEMQVVS